MTGPTERYFLFGTKYGVRKGKARERLVQSYSYSLSALTQLPVWFSSGSRNFFVKALSMAHVIFRGLDRRAT
jgi:hypothetical protein